MSFQKMDLNDRVRPKGRNVVLLHGYSGFDIQKINSMVETSGIDEWLYIDEKRESMIINDILINEKDNDVHYTPHKDKVILFNGTSQYELQQLLNRILTLSKERPYIAMATQTSVGWTFAGLIKELKQERKELNKTKNN
jgi:hypothetical protein